MEDLETQLHTQGYTYIAGIDEAGRGCLVGNVVAAAVILPPNCIIEGLNDSKKLSAKQREALFAVIHKKALSIGIGMCNPLEIDTLNILWAAMEAMKRAVSHLHIPPDYLLIDGNRVFPDIHLPFQTLVKGDSRIQSIAAASIIAKVTRDQQMEALDTLHPQYGFAKHKGYATAKHYQAIQEFGILPEHRKSFRLG